MSRARDTAGIIQYNKISIDSNNAVGIGSSIPDTKLDVNGGVRVTGIITASSFQGDGSALTGISTENLAPNTLVVAGISTFNNALLLNSSLSKINTASGVNVVFQDQGTDKLHFEVQSQSIRPETANTGEVGNASYPFAKVTAQNALITNILDVNGGADVTGIVTATTFSGSGASLTTLNASELDSGTIPDARFPATLPAVSGANLTDLNIPASFNDLDAALFS